MLIMVILSIMAIIMLFSICLCNGAKRADEASEKFFTEYYKRNDIKEGE